MSLFPLSFTTRCVLCYGACPGSKTLCATCHGDLPWIESACRGCGLPLPTAADQLYCGECLEIPSPFHHVVAPFYYRAPLRQWITGFKHRQQWPAGRMLGHLLLQQLREHYLYTPLPEVIVPIPLHWRRLLWRGYNQSAVLGQQLARELAIPCRTDLLKRIRRTSSQQGLGRQQRLHNLEHAFKVSGHNPFKRIALLDDVVTTGTTVQTAARLLRANHATEIHLWTLARTPVDKSGA